MIDTKQKILDTAEHLLGSQRYDATSLRQIINEAGVNLAAIHYHFCSKEELLTDLIACRAGPVNQKRLALLDQVEAEAAAIALPPTIEKVLEAFLIPMSEAADRNPQFVRVMGRVYTEGLMSTVLQKNFQEVIARFLAAMRRALPTLPEEEFLWRVHFMTGAMAHTMCGPADYTRVSVEPSPFRDRIARLIAFLSAGFHAPVTQPDHVKVSQ